MLYVKEGLYVFTRSILISELLLMFTFCVIIWNLLDVFGVKTLSKYTDVFHCWCILHRLGCSLSLCEMKWKKKLTFLTKYWDFFLCCFNFLIGFPTHQEISKSESPQRFHFQEHLNLNKTENEVRTSLAGRWLLYILYTCVEKQKEQKIRSDNSVNLCVKTSQTDLRFK